MPAPAAAPAGVVAHPLRTTGRLGATLRPQPPHRRLPHHTPQRLPQRLRRLPRAPRVARGATPGAVAHQLIARRAVIAHTRKWPRGRLLAASLRATLRERVGGSVPPLHSWCVTTRGPSSRPAPRRLQRHRTSLWATTWRLAPRAAKRPERGVRRRRLARVGLTAGQSGQSAGRMNTRWTASRACAPREARCST